MEVSVFQTVTPLASQPAASLSRLRLRINRRKSNVVAPSEQSCSSFVRAAYFIASSVDMDDL